jgi:signal transduction histidine kinase
MQGVSTESAAHLQSLLTALDDIFFEINGNQVFKNVWARHDSMLFMPKESFLGKKVSDVMGPLSGMLADAISRTIATGNQQEIIYPHLDPTVTQWYKVTIRPVIKSPSLDDYILILQVSDVTERIRTEREHAEKTVQLDGLLQNLPIVVFKIKNDGTIMSVAGAGLEQLFPDTAELIGKNVFELFPATTPHLQKVVNGERLRFTTKVGNNGIERYFDSIVFPNSNGDEDNMIGFAMDVTQSKLDEEEIQKNHAELQQQSVNLANLNEFKDKILAIISHDVRSPLNSLAGLLAVPGVFSSEYEGSGIKNTIIEQLNSVESMVSNLLSWAAMSFKDAGEIFEQLSINELLEDNIALLHETASSKNVHVINNLSPDTLVMGNKVQMSIVLRNLLTNAIKFTPANGEVVLTSALEGDYVSVSVIDTGIGMNEAQLKKLFTARHQSTYGTNGEKGTGIGLLLSKEYIERSGGQIQVVSEPFKGSVFTIRLKSASTQAK